MDLDELKDMEDKVIICPDCGVGFKWSRGEQAFYKSRDLSPPVRCKACREIKNRRRVPHSWEGGQA